MAGVPRGEGQRPENLPLPVQERAALPGKRKCRFHGGLSTGPKTAEGRRKCAAVRTIHGDETYEARRNRVGAMARIRAVVDLAVDHGILKRRVAGRKGKSL